MGTAVLSPRDCLPSSHNPHNYQLSDMIYSSASAPRSRRNALPASVVQRVLPSLASDHARRNLSGTTIIAGEMELRNGSPGLLPVPDNRLHSRHSSQTRSSSTFFSPRHFSSAVSLSVRQSAASPAPSLPYPSSTSSAGRNTSSTGKLPASRSTSTGLLSRGLGRESLNSSNGRLPFKSVQSSGVVDKVVYEFGSAAALRFSDVKSRLERKYIGGSEQVGDLKKRTNLDFSHRRVSLENDGMTSSGKPTVEEDGGTMMQRKGIEAKRVGNGRHPERSNTGNNTSEMGVGAPPPVVTILQRPKTKEAANELIASFLGKVASSPPLNAVSDLDNHLKLDEVLELELPSKERDNEDLSGSACCQTTVVRATKNHSVDRPCFDAGESDLTSRRESSHVVKLRRQASVDAQSADRKVGGHPEVTTGVQTCRSEIEVDTWLSMVGIERWAGPAYSNSPCPSSLPLPKFSTKMSKISSPESSPVSEQHVGTALDNISGGKSLTPRRSRSFRSWMPVSGPEGAWDVTFATQNLRKMLNLDSC